jgi:DNA helicase TIP49 (TBP-interacting protein)
LILKRGAYRDYWVGTLATTTGNHSNYQRPRGIIIEIPLKPRKRTISLRLDEESLCAIDKFTVMSGEISRTLLITRVVEALAKGLKETNYKATKLELRFIVNSPGNEVEKEVSIVISLKSS